MEPKMEAIRKNIKGLFLVEQNCLKKFTIPKKSPDKDFLTECSADQRDYNEIKQRLNENCLDIQCNLESLWQFHKIEMVHNKDLEEEFIAKRTKLREEGKQDKELSSFLVASRDEVLKICQNGLCTGHSKRELNIMKELGNPQLGVYLFRYVDVALNYASKHSVPVENIIIFRVLLGKVKKIQPPKGQKKIVLDPTPNCDCHMSRVQPSLKDSLEDQAIESLVYFYEYNELSKPVDKPRQCLPYAVIHVKSANQKRRADSFVTSLKCRLKRLPKHMGRVVPLENCTRVTRIGKSQLIYEHFRKPLEMCVSAEVASFSRSLQNWNDCEEKIHCKKKKCKSAKRWDSIQMETNIQCKSGVEASIGIRGEHVGDGKKNSLRINPEDPSDYEAGSSTVTTSRLIKDPRLTRREQNVVKQNEELIMKPPDDISMSTCKPSPENITSSKDKKHNRGEMDSQFQQDDISPSEIEHFTKCATNSCTSSKAEHCGNIFQCACFKKMYVSENNHVYESSSDEITSENFEQNKLQAVKNLNLKSKNSNIAEINKKDKQIYSASEKVDTSPDKDYTINKIKEKSSKIISNIESIKYPCDTCITDTVIRDLSEKSTCLSKTELLEKNNFEDGRTCISLGLLTDGQKNSETNNTVDICFNEICVNQLEEEIPCGKKGKKYNSATETAFKNAAENLSRRKQEPLKKDLRKPVGNINNCIETSENLDTLDLESPDFVFNLSFQRSSLTETEQMNREHCKEKFEELQDQTLLTKSIDLTGHEEGNHTMLLTSVPVSLRNMGNTEINKLSENTTSSNASSEGLNKNLFCRQVPEIFGQDLEIKCDYINIHSLDISGEIENVLEECKKCLSVWHNPCNHGNISEELGYHYLQERLDWDNLFGKPDLNLSESPTLKENEGNSLYREKSGEEEGTQLFNTFSCPDLQITITNIFQSKLETEMEKCSTKYSAPKKYIKWSRGEKKKKCTKGQQNSKLYRRNRELNMRSSSQMFSSLHKGQFKKTEQSEKHVKNILNALNDTEALLCKNKHPSQKIIGAMFHLRKARKSVQHLKTVTKAGRKTPGGALSKAKKVLQDGALVLDSSETSGCNMDISCSSDCAKNKQVTKTASEKNVSLGTTDIKSLEPVSGEPIMCNKQRFAVEGSFGNTQEKNQERVIAAMENIEQTLSSDTNSCRSQTDGNQFDSSLKGKELTVRQRSQTNGDETFKSNVKMSTVTIATPIQPRFESAKVNVFQSDDISGPNPNFTALKKTSKDKEALEVPASQEEKMALSAGRCHASLACWSLAEDNLNAKTSIVQLTPEMHSNRSLSLKTKSNSSSNKNVGINCSETPAGSFSRQKQKVDSRCKKDYSKSEHCCLNTFSQTAKREIHTAENRHCKPLGKSVKHPGNNTKGISPSGDLPSPASLVDANLCQSSHHCVLQKLEEENTEETEIPERKTDSAAKRLDIIHDIPVKSLNNRVLSKKTMKQTNHVTLGESTCRQTSSGCADNCNQLHFNSLLTAVSEQDLETITAATTFPSAYYHVTPDETNQLFTTTETRQNENYFSSTSSNHSSYLSNNIKLSKVGIGLKLHDFNLKISEILQKADKTSSLNILHEQISCCRSVLPLFIRAFERKQGCSFERVLISREIPGSTRRNMQARPKLKPCAIEALVELQIVMETMEFIENKKKILKGEPTFRSLLWYDDSLYSELFGGHSGYQQQSNFYPAFQRRLKYSALNELQIYHKQLVEAFENTISENNSYYSLLKLRREIQECESVMKQISNLSDFFLSVPFICGANFGDSIEDLENSRKSTVDLINISKSLPGMNLSAEKDNHLWIIMEIIGKKIEFVKTCTNEVFNLKTSLFGLEHIFFDAAKNLVWEERNIFLNSNSKDGKEVLQINEIAVAKLYEIYERMLEDSGCENNHRTSGGHTEKCTEDPHNCEEADSQYNANCFIGKSLTLQHDCCVSEILDEAQSADTERLQQLMGRCTVHIEMLKKYFQILQEEDATLLITQENVLDFMKNGGIHPVILKPEATEVYTELAMIYETFFSLKNSIAKQVDKPRFRSLLWFDLSLLPELFQCQEKMASLSYRKDKLLKTVESSISELQDELNVVYDYAENLNCSYALHLLTRELAELSETRKLLGSSTSPVSMCVDLAPYAVSLNYGSTVSELDCNYNQFSSLLEKLMLAEKKDLGKMAHIMKVMKTIEHMKFICSEQGKSPLPVVIHQMLKNWRKACQLKRQLMETQLDYSKQTLQASQILHKRPFNVALEDRPCSSEEKIDLSHNKKKKVAASLMTTTKIDEKETSRNMRNSGKYNSSEGEELQLKIRPDTQNRKIRNLRERTPVTFSQLKAAYPYECIHASTDASELRLNNADALATQQNLKNVKEGRKSSQNAKEHEKYFSSYSDINKCTSVSPVKVQRSPEEAVSAVEKLGENNSLLATKNAHWELKSDGLESDSDVQSEHSIDISLSPGSRNGKKSEIPNYPPTYNSESSMMTELNKSMELHSFHSEPSFSDSIQNSGECSAISQNEYFEGTSTHIYRTGYPYYSWYFYHIGSNSHLVTQTYQELNSYEIHPLNPAGSATASMVNSAYSSRFHTQTISHFDVRESQSFNVAQAYPVHGYFSSIAAYPYSYQQPPTWYAENWPLSSAVFPYPSNVGL